MIALSSSKFVKTLLALAGRPCTLGDAKALHRRRRRLTIALGGWLRRSAGFAFRGRFRLWRSGFRRCRRLLRAGPPGAGCDAETLDLWFGLGRLGRRFRLCLGCRHRRCRLLRAGPPCTRGDAESLHFGFGLGRHFRGGCFGGGRCGLLGAGTLGARGDAEPLSGRGSGRFGSGCLRRGGRRLLRTRTLRPTGDTASVAVAACGFGSGLASGSASTAGADASARTARSSASFAAVPFSGSVIELLSSEPSSNWATSSTSAFGRSVAAATSSTPSVIITRQNGQPVAIFDAPVSSASSTRS